MVKSELSGKHGYRLEKHHIFPRGSHPEIIDDPRNHIKILPSEHREVHSTKRKELTFKMFDIKSKEPDWVDWASEQHSKLFTEWLERFYENR